MLFFLPNVVLGKAISILLKLSLALYLDLPNGVNFDRLLLFYYLLLLFKLQLRQYFPLPLYPGHSRLLLSLLFFLFFPLLLLPILDPTVTHIHSESNEDKCKDRPDNNSGSDACIITREIVVAICSLGWAIAVNSTTL